MGIPVFGHGAGWGLVYWIHVDVDPDPNKWPGRGPELRPRFLYNFKIMCFFFFSKWIEFEPLCLWQPKRPYRIFVAQKIVGQDLFRNTFGVFATYSGSYKGMVWICCDAI